MRIIQLDDTRTLEWHSHPELACLHCQAPLGWKNLYHHDRESARMHWPDMQALLDGEYCYLHQRCALPALPVWIDVYLILGLQIRRWRYYEGAVQYFKQRMPPAAWDRIQADWAPHCQAPPVSA